ncbi:heme-degrading monooxygenase HmoA [Paenibacillus shirakamiensis]|uniref:Heme-degrading monooxygenase HmoA n=1 Tax=Paenibacillus shirakamiensis TaxID=1265935 RepID=A0ABS4JMY1_9BACL|nr:DUF4937 domain-containing protein [Paenibacillus shirakamiensis]MBP2001974.1 heme-degrading monooxygenase HmoA [Paenibacillus shirakamiensis]
MIIKWITCHVEEQNRSAFAYAQEQWNGLETSEGFHWQIGGWDLKHPSEAAILSCWDNINVYRTFMQHQHDAMFLQTNQRDTYERIQISIFEDCFPINSMNGTENLMNRHILRIAECEVRPIHQASFEQAQHEVWNYEMSQSEGMLGGMFCRQGQQTAQHTHSQNQQDVRYLIASIWDSRDSHQHYVDFTLSNLLKQTGARRSAHIIKGRLIELDPLWTVEFKN